MGKSLIIPGADFSSVAIPFIMQVTIAANKTAVIYNGNNNAFLTIPSSAQDETVDLTDELLKNSPTLFDLTLAREGDVFKKILVNLSYATTCQYGFFNVSGVTSILEEIKFFGKNTNNIDISNILTGQNKITSVDMSCLYGTPIASASFRNCPRVENINLHNVKGLTSWNYLCGSDTALKTIDLTSAETLGNVALSIGDGPFAQCSALEKIICPNLASAGVSLLIKQIASGANILTKYADGNIVKVATNGTPGWTTTTGAPDVNTMTLWDDTVWDNPVQGTTYYVDASLNRLYTYNG